MTICFMLLFHVCRMPQSPYRQHTSSDVKFLSPHLFKEAPELSIFYNGYRNIEKISSLSTFAGLTAP